MSIFGVPLWALYFIGSLWAVLDLHREVKEKEDWWEEVQKSSPEIFMLFKLSSIKMVTYVCAAIFWLPVVIIDLIKKIKRA